MLKALYGHDILPESNALIINQNIFLEKRRVIEVLKHISQHRCVNPVKEDISEVVHSKEMHHILTFDDGFYSLKSQLLPLLEKYQVPVIIFITTGFVGDKKIAYEVELEEMIKQKVQIQTLDGGIHSTENQKTKEKLFQQLRLPLKNKSTRAKDRYMKKLFALNGYKKANGPLYLRWKDIIELDKHPLITIGAHTLTHPVLTAIKLKDAYTEIKKSKKILENKLKHKISFFSYPYGSNNFYIRKLVQLAGFKYAFTTEEKIVDNSNFNRFKIPRFDINSIT